jgi:hypothetical protein
MKQCISFLLIAALGSCASSSGTRTVYLLGRFTAPLGRSEFAQALTSQGHIVVNSMTPGVDLVVVGTDPVSEDGTRFVSVRDLPEYSVATTRGIAILDKTAAVDCFHLSHK